MNINTKLSFKGPGAKPTRLSSTNNCTYAPVHTSFTQDEIRELRSPTLVRAYRPPNYDDITFGGFDTIIVPTCDSPELKKMTQGEYYQALAELEPDPETTAKLDKMAAEIQELSNIASERKASKPFIVRILGR